MADEPEKKTPIQNKYAQQYADDLAANRKEQGGISKQIASLQERLEQLKVEEVWLAQALGSLPGAPAASEHEAAPSADKAEQPETSAPAEAVAEVPQTVPQPRQNESVKPERPKQPAKKTATAKKTAAKKTAKKTTAKAAKEAAAEKSAAEQVAAPEAAAPEAPAESTEEKAGPPLWQLLLDILLKTPGQPCVAREVTDQLAQDHPSRKTTIQTVRNNLETLVKKNLAEKSYQQKNAMYTAYADADAAAAPAADGAADSAADSEAEQVPETAAEKVPAEV